MQFRPSVIDEKKEMIVKISCMERSGFGRSDGVNSYIWMEMEMEEWRRISSIE